MDATQRAGANGYVLRARFESIAWLSIRAAAAGALSVVAACATVKVPDRVEFAIRPSSRPLPEIRDARAEADKVFRAQRGRNVWLDLVSESTLEPTILQQLRHRFADTLPLHLREARIELRQADIGIRVTQTSPEGDPERDVLGAMPFGPLDIGVIPIIFSRALISLIRSPATIQNLATAYLLVTVNGEALSASESVEIRDHVTQDAVREAVTRAIDSLASQVGTLRAPPVPEADPAPTP